ncbi:hypothetical protein G6L30_08145 [Agrobacterium rhizogenes]|nr:hypothetical protein [Rhizobium rhizogenes]
MNKMEIANLFIRAAFIDSRLPIDAGPKRLKSAWVKYAARTEADQRKWFIREETDRGPSKLHKGDKGPIHDWWMEFWDGRSVDTSRNDVRLWELANEMMTLVADEQNRRALWAWAMSKVGTLKAHQTKQRKTIKKLRAGDPSEKLKIHKRTSYDVSFAAWCRSEGIHEMTGSRRKDRAIAVMEQYLVRGISPNAKSWQEGLLPVGGIFEHIADTVATDAPNQKERFVERDADTVFCKEGTVFDWREMRKAEAHRRADLRKQRAA